MLWFMVPYLGCNDATVYEMYQRISLTIAIHICAACMVQWVSTQNSGANISVCTFAPAMLFHESNKDDGYIKYGKNM